LENTQLRLYFRWKNFPIAAQMHAANGHLETGFAASGMFGCRF
jgi:hypothetical protein